MVSKLIAVGRLACIALQMVGQEFPAGHRLRRYNYLRRCGKSCGKIAIAVTPTNGASPASMKLCRRTGWFGTRWQQSARPCSRAVLFGSKTKLSLTQKWYESLPWFGVSLRGMSATQI